MRKLRAGCEHHYPEHSFKPELSREAYCIWQCLKCGGHLKMEKPDHSFNEESCCGKHPLVPGSKSS